MEHYRTYRKKETTNTFAHIYPEMYRYYTANVFSS